MGKRKYLPAVKVSYLPFFVLTFQVVANKPVHVVAKPVVAFLRLPLLSPEELKTVEEENEKDGLIPVRIRLSIETYCRQRGLTQYRLLQSKNLFSRLLRKRKVSSTGPR